MSNVNKMSNWKSSFYCENVLEKNRAWTAKWTAHKENNKYATRRTAMNVKINPENYASQKGRELQIVINYYYVVPLVWFTKYKI